MEPDTGTRERVSIWGWVGAVLLTFGAIVLGAGLAQLDRPPTTVLGELRPRLWWGGLMCLAGVVFVLVERTLIRARPEGGASS